MVKRTQTKWKWFAAAAIPSTLVASGLMVGVANGAVPVALNISGDEFKVSADKLEGSDFRQFASIAFDASASADEDGDGVPDDALNDLDAAHPVAASAIGSAELTDLCQSVLVEPLPGILPPVSMLISAGDAGTPAKADNLLIGLTDLRGDATFNNIEIGTDGQVLAETVGESPLTPVVGGTIGQRADGITIKNLKQTAVSTTAGTFTLPNLHLALSTDAEECF